MKAMKKILAALLCLCVACSCVVFAVSATEQTGSITIQNPSNSDATVAGKTFNIYKIFNATTNGNNTSYSWYKTDDEKIPFYDFFYGEWKKSETETVTGVLGKQADGNVQKAVEYLAQFNGEGHNFDLSQIAEDLHDYITCTNVATIKPITAGDKATSITIPDLDYGYYLVYDATDLKGSAVRSAVMLSTVNKDAVITLKANRPQILKQVEENNGSFGKGTSVNIGDVVTFKITTSIPSHTLYTTYQYYIEDTMPKGLKLDENSIKVLHDETPITDKVSIEKTNLDAGVDFKVDFTEILKDTTNYKTDDKLYIVYDAKVTNKIAPSNQNTAKLVYSNDPTKDDSTGSVSDSANVYSYQFVFTKFAQDTDGILTNVRLSGAEFQLYKVDGDSDELITFTTETALNTEGVEFLKYIVADGDEGPVDTLVVQNKGESTITLDHINMGGHLGDVFIFGLAEGNYKLVETKAPDGYVLPKEPFVIEIVDEIGALGSVATLKVNGSHENDDAGKIVNTHGIAEGVLTVWAEITNKPGSALPETGGMGTTLFTVIGIVMMVGAVAFFTSRKRSSVA